MKTDTDVIRLSNDINDWFPGTLDKYQCLDLAIKLKTLEVLKATLGYSQEPGNQVTIGECILEISNRLRPFSVLALIMLAQVEVYR